MALLLDLFGYLSIVLHGIGNAAQAGVLGAIVFLTFLLRPLVPRLGEVALGIAASAARVGGIGALLLAVAAGLEIAMQATLLMTTVELSLLEAIGASSALAMLTKAGAALALAVLFARRGGGAPLPVLLMLGGVVLVAATLTTHAAARLHDRAPLLAFSALHQLGAAIWIGGLPCFLLALRQVEGGNNWRLIGARYSRMAMLGVAIIITSGLLLCLSYIGSWQGLYGTAYGAMVGAKIAMLCLLLVLGAGNFLLVERLRRDPATPINRLRCFT